MAGMCRSHLMSNAYILGTVIIMFFVILSGECRAGLVTSTNDSGAGSLRYCISNAVAGDTIQFESSLAGKTIKLNSSLPSITKALTIIGLGANQLAIDGRNTYKVFNVALTATVTISGLTITHGSGGNGAGIRNDGNLTILDCIISSNQTTLGHGAGIYNSLNLTILNCTISDNSILIMGGYCGGGIYFDGSYGGSMTVSNCIFSGNNTGSWGGGIYYSGNNNAFGTLTICNSTFFGNRSGYGQGAAIEVSGGSSVLTGCAVYNNGGIAIINGGTMAITACTISGNGNTSGGFDGGGICNNGELTVSDSTVSGNTAYDGGGIYNYGTLVVNDSTITQNLASDINGGGGGIYNISYGSVFLKNTIVAGNHNGNAPDIYGPVAANYCLLGHGFGTITGTGNILTENPLLASLDSYGGPTMPDGSQMQTIALLPGSPAIDAGTNSLIPPGLTTDQRGYFRIASNNVDIGAYEYQPVVTNISPRTGPTAGGATVTITGRDLTGATPVKFGGTSASNVVVNSATQITATSPAGSAGTVDVRVVTPVGTSAISPVDQFTYVVAPTVTGVTSAAANGSYKAGTVIPIKITFSMNVTVNIAGGTPSLSLNDGGTAIYASGSGTSTLTFNYTVASGQNNADLDYASPSALAFNGGTIQDAGGNNAILTLTTPGTAGSLGANKDIVIDTTAPAVPVITGISTDNGINSNDGITSDQTLVINGTAEANSTVAVTRVGLGVIGTCTANGSGGWSFDYTGTTLSAGNYNFTATAMDAVGNVSLSSLSFNVTIDTTAPALAITSPANNAVVNSANLTVTGTASDNGRGNNGVSSVTVNNVSASGGTASGANTANWSVTIALSPGANTITVVVTDTVNNSGQQQISVTYNSPPNTPTLSSPANGATGQSLTPTLQASAFFDPDGDTHINSRWQVSRNTAFSNLAWDSGSDYSATVQTVVPIGVLVPSSNYYWRVCYKDSRGGWSDWSTSRSFGTLPAFLTIGASGRDCRWIAISGQIIDVSANISWTATANNSWITVASGASGSGNGTVVYNVGVNHDLSRSGTITITGGGITRIFTLNQAECTNSCLSDYNANGLSDLPVFNPANGAWYVRETGGEQITWANQWGWSTAKPIVGDYDGDGKFDMAVFDTAGGYWYIKAIAGNTILWANQWGWSTARPVPGDYDGDGKSDQAIFDTVGGYWYIKAVAGDVITWKNQWGWSTAKPVPGDYDGDGKWDQAVFDTQGGYWYIKSVAGPTILWKAQWGWSTAKPVSGDYDGDGKYDLAVFDTVGGYWYIRTVAGPFITWKNQWGWSTAKPIPGDYNGDGKFDMAVYDTATGYWYIKSLDGTIIAWAVQWGWPGATVPALGD